MRKILIEGGRQLFGNVDIGGAKNAAVAIIPAAILSDGVCKIENVPNISDITLICEILQNMGASIKLLNKSTIEIDARGIKMPVATDEKVCNMRASYYLLGSLLGRFNRAKVPLPGGCKFGPSVRPIDQHLKGFAALGAKHSIKNGLVCLESDRLVGNYVYFDVVSIGATINIMLAAVRTKGETVIENAAKEPHVVDLANFLNCMGADIRGAGTDVIKIRGVKHLSGCTYSIIPDQIEAGTYMAAVVATGGDITINGITPRHLEGVSAKLEEMGAKIYESSGSLRVKKDPTKRILKTNIKTMPYPGFPTDLQPQFSTVLALAEGTSIVTETVWDNRFRYVEELKRMGAEISVEGKVAIIEGTKKLLGTTVKASDLRAGAALVIAGLAANGTTCVDKINYIERGYENIVGKFSNLGAKISYLSQHEADESSQNQILHA